MDRAYELYEIKELSIDISFQKKNQAASMKAQKDLSYLKPHLNAKNEKI